MSARWVGEDADPLNVECDACGAPAGERCRPDCIGKAKADDDRREGSVLAALAVMGCSSRDDAELICLNVSVVEAVVDAVLVYIDEQA